MKVSNIKARWSLTAAPADMVEAENLVLGEYANHMSSPVFGFSDHDDEPPEIEERRVDLYPHRYPEDMAKLPAFWRLAAALGDKGMVAVNIESDAVWAHINTGAKSMEYVTVDDSVLNAELRERIAQAKMVLDGRSDGSPT